MLALNVSYNQKEEAKSLGARWNTKEKTWMAPGNTYEEYKRFEKWIEGSNIITKELYIVESSRKCWKCGKDTPVICFGVHDWYNVELNGEMCQGWKFISILSQIPEEVVAYVESKFNFKLKYSNTVRKKYYANCCKWCDSLQGNNYLFTEALESPFYVNDLTSAQKLIMHRIKLSYDFSADFGEQLPIVIGAGCIDIKEREWLIDNYAQFKDISM